MNVKPVSNWKSVVRHAWSVRLLIVAGLLSGAEAVMTMVGGAFELTPEWRLAMIVATPFVITGAFVARLVAQQTVNKGKSE